jgi:uncharacterized membrane protein YccC
MESRQKANRLPHIRDAFVIWHTSVDSPRPEIAEGLLMAVGIFVPILFILKPNFGGTLQRAALRFTGTVLGGLIAAAVSLTIREDVILIGILPVLAFIALSVRPINYGLYTLALTPMIMVMLDVGHTANWATSFLRVLHTFIGGILAVLGGYLLFPIWEKQKLPGELAVAVKANADFFGRSSADPWRKTKEREHGDRFSEKRG